MFEFKMFKKNFYPLKTGLGELYLQTIEVEVIATGVEPTTI